MPKDNLERKKTALVTTNVEKRTGAVDMTLKLESICLLPGLRCPS